MAEHDDEGARADRPENSGRPTPDDGPDARPQSERMRDARTRAEIDAAFAEITAELGPTDLTPAAIQPGPEHASDLGGPRDFSLAAEPDTGYEPPTPEPIDVSDPFRVSAWVATIGGPIALLAFAIFWPAAPPLVWIACLVLAVVGGVALAWRLPRHRRDPDDDGAVV